MLVLGPRAVERLESYDPPWPLPKIFRMKKGGKVNRAIFEGDTINTPSMLCVEDYLDALKWAGGIGLDGLIARSMANLRVVEEWVAKNDWIAFLAASPGDPLQHLGLPLRGQRQGHGAAEGGAGEIPQGHRRRDGQAEGRLRHRLLQGRPSGIPLLVRPHDRPRGHPHRRWRSWRRFTGKRSPRYRHPRKEMIHEENSDQRQPVRGRDRDIQEDAGDRGRRQDEDDPRRTQGGHQGLRRPGHPERHQGHPGGHRPRREAEPSSAAPASAWTTWTSRRPASGGSSS